MNATVSPSQPSRRSILAVGAFALAAQPLLAADLRGMPQLARRPTLRDVARSGLDRHGAMIAHTDVVGIADFAQPSRVARFHLVDMAAGTARPLLVAHGRGSDPDHSGWVQRFSNVPGSAASSAGGYLTGALYEGKHGRSMRLHGLDPDNDNALARAIVVHGAWYVAPAMLATHGKLGRSEGCFAFDETELAEVLERLGPGRLIYAGRFGFGASASAFSS